jgi:hypothetical protein
VQHVRSAWSTDARHCGGPLTCSSSWATSARSWVVQSRRQGPGLLTVEGADTKCQPGYRQSSHAVGFGHCTRACRSLLLDVAFILGLHDSRLCHTSHQPSCLPSLLRRARAEAAPSRSETAPARPEARPDLDGTRPERPRAHGGWARARRSQQEQQEQQRDRLHLPRDRKTTPCDRYRHGAGQSEPGLALSV